MRELAIQVEAFNQDRPSGDQLELVEKKLKKKIVGDPQTGALQAKWRGSSRTGGPSGLHRPNGDQVESVNLPEFADQKNAGLLSCRKQFDSALTETEPMWVAGATRCCSW